MRYLRLLLIFLLFFSIQVIFAQDSTPPPPDKGPGLPGLPIDGILWLGGLFAVFYGSIKTYFNSKK